MCKKKTKKEIKGRLTKHPVNLRTMWSFSRLSFIKSWHKCLGRTRLRSPKNLAKRNSHPTHIGNHRRSLHTSVIFWQICCCRRKNKKISHQETNGMERWMNKFSFDCLISNQECQSSVAWSLQLRVESESQTVLLRFKFLSTSGRKCFWC